MRFSQSAVSTILLFPALIGCDSRPSEAFIELVKKDREGSATPEITVRLGRALEERTFSGPKGNGLRKAMEILGNQMGFRVEASAGGTRFMPSTRCVVVDFKDPGMPGVSITREADVVRIRPDYRKDMIIESATTPREGFEKMMAAANVGQDKVGAEAMLSPLGDKDAKGTVATMEVVDRETRKRKALFFEANVDRVRMDNGFAKAWFITYRLRHATNIPGESPFWSLMDALGKARTKDVIERNPAFNATSAFWSTHGKQDTKATLATYSVVAFQDSKGGLAKTEGWLAFKGE